MLGLHRSNLVNVQWSELVPTFFGMSDLQDGLKARVGYAHVKERIAHAHSHYEKLVKP